MRCLCTHPQQAHRFKGEGQPAPCLWCACTKYQPVRKGQKTVEPTRDKLRKAHPRAGSRLEAILAQHIKLEGLPQPELQYRFAKEIGREFRFDFAWPDRKLAAEVDGGRFLLRRSKKQHGRLVPVGYHATVEDYRKMNAAIQLGWRVLKYTDSMVTSGEAVRELRSILMPKEA